ncbi:hypothetical protein VE03_10716, partial [Pseudogymnoascus sp. 23342-1-I1]
MAHTRSKSKRFVPAAEVEMMLDQRDQRIRELEKENARLCDLHEVFIDDASKF